MTTSQCNVLRCQEPAAAILANIRGVLLETVVCDAHTTAIERGDEFYWQQQDDGADRDTILIGDDLRQAKIFEITDATATMGIFDLFSGVPAGTRLTVDGRLLGGTDIERFEFVLSPDTAVGLRDVVGFHQEIENQATPEWRIGR